MILKLDLPLELERMLRDRAARQGRDIADVALEIVQKALAEGPSKPQARNLTHEQRLEALQAWVRKLPRVDVDLDVSRESIYEGCGE